MPKLSFADKAYTCRGDETVLDAFLRQGVNIPFSCRKGICHVCLHRAVSGPVPEAAQSGLRPTLRQQGYFLPCKCVPRGDLEIAPPRAADLYSRAVVYAKELLAPDVCKLLLEPATPLYYRAGQFVNLKRPDGLSRSYSLASTPGQDYFLELHVRRLDGGVMSNWIFDGLKVNDEIDIHGPEGNCYYVPGDRGQNILLIGTGTGLAPLLGIVRDALHSGHTGEIHLYHGSREAAGIYLRDTLLDLSAQYPNFRFIGCVSGKNVPPGFVGGRAHDVAFELHAGLAGWRVYLAGRPEMVHAARATAEHAGARPAAIHTDPFELRDLRRPSSEGCAQAGGENGGDCASHHVSPAAPAATAPASDRRRDPLPDPEMWEALGNGERLNEILADFYTHVYADDRLLPFFKGITKQRSIEKQYLFLRQIFTGEKVYFGDRPRNAHHWMVISDELFDYREELMESTLRRHGLPERLVRRWRAMEEIYRADIVKSSPWKRMLDGMELPVEGFGEVVLDVGTICDGCGAEIGPGTRVRYHLRLGSTYCPACGEQRGETADGRTGHG